MGSANKAIPLSEEEIAALGVEKREVVVSYGVGTTGMIRPMSFLVRSLNSLVKAAMFTPCWPRAGPTGGAGVAWPGRIRERRKNNG